MIFHIPHSSTVLPERYLADFALSAEDLREELRLMTDWHTKELFRAAWQQLGCAIEFPVSRLLVDPERFADDNAETMAALGMGVIYTHTAHSKPLRYPGTDQGTRRAQLLQEFYLPHHAALTAAVDKELAATNQTLIVDCHSFPSAPLPYELDQSRDRPDICIGTDEFHTPDWLRDQLVQGFEACGYSVTVNRPFAGALTPAEYYGKDKRVQSVMIEVNRQLYMDETSTESSLAFNAVSEAIKTTLIVCE